MNKKTLEAEAKKIFQSFYNIPEGLDKKTRRSYLKNKLRNYPGLNIVTEFDKLCQFLNVKGYIYAPSKVNKADDRHRLTLNEKYNTTATDGVLHVINIPMDDGTFHMVAIKDLKILNNDFLVCPHCKRKVLDKSKGRYHYNANRFHKHVKKCKENGGKLVKEVNLCSVQRPYAPHIQKQRIYEFLLAHGIEHLFRPTKSYITYDFETVENAVDISTAKTLTNAELLPFMVSSTVCSNGTIQETVNFCIDTEDKFSPGDVRQSFITSWISWLFDRASQIAQDNINMYFNNPEFINALQSLTEDQQEDIKGAIEKEMFNVCIIGFNSSKFDINLFIRNLNTHDWKVKTMIGSSSIHKVVVVKKMDDSPTALKFIDIRCYLAGGTLDTFTRDFGFSNSRIKSFFPYEAITTENWVTELAKSEPFTQKSFDSQLTNSSISDQDYATYLEDTKNFTTRMEYFKHYCNVDTKIMVEPINNLIDIIFEHKIDMLHNYSLSSNASTIKYAKLYSRSERSKEYTDFNPSATYPSTKLSEVEPFFMSKKYWNMKCQSYVKQDQKQKRDTSNNVSDKDYHHFAHIIKTSTCKLCGEPFTKDNKPSLDRIDNDKPHTKDNIQLTCEYCNKYKADRDEKVMKLRINLRKYCLLNNLPMTLASNNKDAYKIIRGGITGGLSNVQHRINLKGITHINKMTYKDKKVSNYDTLNIMTHFIGVDFNSLYPSAFSSMKHDFIKYTDNKMYMPGRLVEHIQATPANMKSVMNIINEKDTLFIAEVKGRIPDEHINEFINFPPIFRNIDINTDEETIGTYMYEYCKANNMITGKPERKLTQLLSTHGEFMPFSSYYLWFLIDRCHFVIDDVKSIITFTKHDKFNAFTSELMNKRQDAELAGNKGLGLFCKIALNGSYGYDAMNTEKYSQIRICDKDKAQQFTSSHRFRDLQEIGEDVYVVALENENFKCDTCLQEAFFTLDNAKYWYLVFIYDFMYKCLDMEKLHFIEGDTDSAYWAVAGNPDEDNTQGFKHVITDHKFYNENIFKFAPFDFYCSDESCRLTLTTKKEQKSHEKKLLGLAVEKQGDNMIALCPKCYTCFDGTLEDGTTKATKCKGVSIKQNPLKHQDYCDVIFKNTTKDGKNTNLRFVKKDKVGRMVRQSVNKSALSGRHTKGVVQLNGCVHPFIMGGL